MLKMFLSLSLIFSSFFMIFLNHPLSLGLFILIQTLILCLLSGMMIYSYWFSYILFLTFMGGLLVLFIYVSSVASNELFKFSPSMKISMLIFIFINLIISMFLFNNLQLINNMMNLDMNNFNNIFLFFNNENNINLSKLYNEQTYFLMMMLIIYLFITLIAVVKITNIFFGPLRSFN
uniref:NADH-ubiquinone oxidoreductase chain 6 n=1 Tax=Apodemia mormo TaxID=42267 RepID=A0A068ER32_APOMO|nr:NADH dehydrogenase subunit 6 [Apodemia mormo]AID52315.1 NADH dehydrogenase subunit 6 [Apodemia mormo]